MNVDIQYLISLLYKRKKEETLGTLYYFIEKWNNKTMLEGNHLMNENLFYAMNDKQTKKNMKETYVWK
jgi:hypothetical protein